MTKKRTPLLDALLDRVESVCKNKSALARELGVSRDHVQKWITSRQYEPGGEITLRLLVWVQVEEEKQKALGSATNTAKSRKTRSTRTSYETRKTSPPPS